VADKNLFNSIRLFGRMDIYFVFYNIFRKGKIMYGKIVNAPSFFEGFKKGEIT